METKRVNQILMHMGGSKCNISHLLKNSFCLMDEIEQMVKDDYLVKCGDGDIVMKTDKAKEIW